jgi:hypothetical protein
VNNKESDMGYFANLEVEIMGMAHDMGDDFGQDAETILVISRALDVSPEEVQRVLEGDPDYNPAEDMDGDHDSAMASAGFGTDEDYGYYGEE